MAHLGSTSLFGLYLVMGGVLALGQRQCMGWGVVTSTPRSLIGSGAEFGPGTSDTGRVTEQMITGNRIFFLFHSGS